MQIIPFCPNRIFYCCLKRHINDDGEKALSGILRVAVDAEVGIASNEYLPFYHLRVRWKNILLQNPLCRIRGESLTARMGTASHLTQAQQKKRKKICIFIGLKPEKNAAKNIIHREKCTSIRYGWLFARAHSRQPTQGYSEITDANSAAPTVVEHTKIDGKWASWAHAPHAMPHYYVICWGREMVNDGRI